MHDITNLLHRMDSCDSFDIREWSNTFLFLWWYCSTDILSLCYPFSNSLTLYCFSLYLSFCSSIYPYTSAPNIRIRTIYNLISCKTRDLFSESSNSPWICEYFKIIMTKLRQQITIPSTIHPWPKTLILEHFSIFHFSTSFTTSFHKN